jgi:hypothetical protein
LSRNHILNISRHYFKSASHFLEPSLQPLSPLVRSIIACLLSRIAFLLSLDAKHEQVLPIGKSMLACAVNMHVLRTVMLTSLQRGGAGYARLMPAKLGYIKQHEHLQLHTTLANRFRLEIGVHLGHLPNSNSSQLTLHLQWRPAQCKTVASSA